MQEYFFCIFSCQQTVFFVHIMINVKLWDKLTPRLKKENTFIVSFNLLYSEFPV
jgi:hypothetical protein